jgi:hypothetical protein
MRFEPRSLVLVALLSTILAAAPLAANFTVSISPQSSFYLDANQSAVNFTSLATGGIPFGPQHNLYIYQWSVQKNTTCPGFASIYAHFLSTLYYAPNGTTKGCVFNILVADNTGNSTSSSTRLIVVNPQMRANGTISRTKYTLFAGQSSIISVNIPTGGTPPYHYQWLVSGSITLPLSAYTANSLCSLSADTPTCVFAANASTTPGVYTFQLQYWDSASIPTVLTSNTVVVRVGPSKNATSTVAAATTSVSSTTSTTSTIPTTSSTTTVVQSIPATPLSSTETIVSDAVQQIKGWIKALIGYVV